MGNATKRPSDAEIRRGLELFPQIQGSGLDLLREQGLANYQLERLQVRFEETRSKLDANYFWLSRERRAGKQTIGAIEDFCVKCLTWLGEMREPTQVVFALGGVRGIQTMIEHGAELTGAFPRERMHGVWATMGMVDEMNGADGVSQKVLFARHLIQRGILSKKTPNIVVVDTGTTKSGGSEQVFTLTLLDDAILSKSEQAEKTNVPRFSGTVGKRGQLHLAFMEYPTRRDAAGRITSEYNLPKIPLQVEVRDFHRRERSEIDFLRAAIDLEDVTHLERCIGRLIKTAGGRIEPEMIPPANKHIPPGEDHITWAYHWIEELAFRHAIEKTLLLTGKIQPRQIIEANKKFLGKG